MEFEPNVGVLVPKTDDTCAWVCGALLSPSSASNQWMLFCGLSVVKPIGNIGACELLPLYMMCMLPPEYTGPLKFWRHEYQILSPVLLFSDSLKCAYAPNGTCLMSAKTWRST